LQHQTRFIWFIKGLAKNPEAITIDLKRRINRRLARRPVSFPFISGDTFRSLAEHVWEHGNMEITPNKIKPGDVIFCQSELLEDLCEKVLSHSSARVTILLGNTDRNFTQQLADLFANTGVVKTFAQNLVHHIPGVEPLPIGLENASYSLNGRPRDFNAIRIKSQKRIFRVMWAFSIETNVLQRTMASNELATIPVADRIGPIKAKQHREALTRYGFVASPPGNGLDCHRTWEAMYLGCVPIVLRSHMTQEYEKLGLPLWVVDSFDDLRDLTEGELQKKYWELSTKFDSEAMWIDYWFLRIKSEIV
jgi:hypothetical protein